MFLKKIAPPDKPNAPEPQEPSSKPNSFHWNFLGILLGQLKGFPTLGATMFLFFAFLSIVAIVSPDFRGVIGIKVSPSGIEFNMDRR